MTVLPRTAWQTRRAAYEATVAPWVNDRRTRAAAGVKHPVRDFLFEYYSHTPAHLARWSPGVNVLLEGATRANIGWNGFIITDGGLVLPAAAFPESRRTYLHWAIRHLETVTAREPAFGCLGLHEWAMVYRTDAVRHSHVPLRLSVDAVDEVVESQGLRCTHFDAFRFFTPAAAPRNRVTLTRADATDHDQPGCIHANMDLYKFAFKLAPFTSGELVAETLALAAEAREVDMRASPYDLSAFGCVPIPIETKAGREEYVLEQRRIAAAAVPVRAKVLAEYRRLAGFGLTPE